jgi:hypothetical protein
MEPYFGPLEWSFANDCRGDKRSFRWPSTVRVGPEASRLSANSKEEQGPTGMSSPKRYLWDTRKRILQWYFNNTYNYLNSPQEQPAVGRGSFVLNINASGIPLPYYRVRERPDIRRAQLPEAIKDNIDQRDTIGAFRAEYSRSSLMMFLLAELVSQALSCINSPMVRNGRRNPNLPRRLKNIILTIPTAMPLAEQNIFKTWARFAVEAVWYSLDWWRDFFDNYQATNDFRQSPIVRCEWYESTCTQLIWLYNEIHKKFSDRGQDLFELLGKRRNLKFLAGGLRELNLDPNEPQNSLRIASIDVGGGTTDISIITYAILNPGHANPFILPYQDFRDGFNVAGDDIMLEVIRKIFFENLIQAAQNNGVRFAKNILKNLFADVVVMDVVRGDERERKQLRGQFISHVAIPVALHILKVYENSNLLVNSEPYEVVLNEILKPNSRAESDRLDEILEYVQLELRNNGWKEFSLKDFSFTIDMKDVDKTVSSIINKILVDMGEVIHYYDCDILILTGRPSRWPAIMRAPYERNFLPVDRIVHMHKYRIGPEYPFVNHGHIEDPKTSVVVGAIICNLAESGLNRFTLDTQNFIPQPINRFVGVLDGDGQLDNSVENLLFINDVDLGKEINETKKYTFTANNTIIGFRQLDCSRWTTTRLYSLEFRDSIAENQSRGFLPYYVELEFTMEEAPEEEINQAAAGRRQNRILTRTEGSLRIRTIENKFRDQLPANTLVVRLKTLRDAEGYWLDTGLIPID